jgi:single-stranded DNA-binding protein
MLYGGCKMNLVILNGRLVKDPDFQEATNTKKAVCYWTLAIDRYYNHKKIATDYVQCVAYGNLAIYIKNNFVKGQPMLVKEAFIRSQNINIAGRKIPLMEVVVTSVAHNLTDNQKKSKFNSSISSDDEISFNDEISFDDEVPF